MTNSRAATARFGRRHLLGMAGAVATAGLLPACSPTQEASRGGPLQVWGGVPAESGPAEVVADFNRRHPEEKVAYTRFINDDRGNLKLDTALQAGADIDVYFTYSTQALSLRSSSGLMLDVTDRVQADPDLAPFLSREQPRSFWAQGRIRALSTGREPNFILINEAKRRQAGAEIPTSWTIEEFQGYARRLTTPDTVGTYTIPDVARIALGPDYRYTASGQSNFDNPHFLQGMRLGQQMIRAGTAYPWSEVLSRHLDIYQQNAFLTGDFATWPSALFNLRYLNDNEEYPHDFRVSCAPVPTVPGGGDWDTGTYGNFIMINPKSPRQDLAWKFVKHWLTDGAPAMLKAGKMPALGNVDPEKVLSGLLGDQPERYFDVPSFHRVLVDHQPKLAVDSELTGFPEIDLAYSQQRDLCWLGEKEPRAAIDDVHSLAQAAIRRNEEPG